ncbi:MAG: peptidoglycan bridge formation glycyltransferase FemA/FemB family protein [FCB group bacterium]|nr:peptidoglycan bridge formation glycyltransferase FemA/FemB family protein [FCB group bacterium]
MKLDLIRKIISDESLQVLLLTDGGKRWLDYLETEPEADICHHPAWGQIFVETFGLPSILITHTTEGRIDGGLPLVIYDQMLTGKAMVSMPYSNYGGLLGQTDQVKRKIIDTCREIISAGNADYIELRQTGESLGNLADHSVKNRITFRLDLDRKSEDIFKAFKKQLRTRLRKADGIGLNWYQGRDRLDDFYRLFAMAMKEHGTPVMPKRHFASMLTHLPDNTEMMIAYKDNRPVGGKLYMKYKDRVTMTRGCYPGRYKHLLANYLLTWELIQQLAGGPIKWLDFGRSAINSGGHKYKSNWGPQEIPIFTEYIAADQKKIPDLKPESAKYRMAISTWKKMPLTITRLIGPRLSRYFT